MKLIITLTLVLTVLTINAQESRSILEQGSTVISNNYEKKYSVFKDSCGYIYKVKWEHDMLPVVKTNIRSHWVCIGKPTYYYTGQLFTLWIQTP